MPSTITAAAISPSAWPESRTIASPIRIAWLLAGDDRKEVARRAAPGKMTALFDCEAISTHRGCKARGFVQVGAIQLVDGLIVRRRLHLFRIAIGLVDHRRQCVDPLVEVHPGPNLAGFR